MWKPAKIVNDQPKNKPSTAPIGTTYTGGVFGDDVLWKNAEH